MMHPAGFPPTHPRPVGLSLRIRCGLAAGLSILALVSCGGGSSSPAQETGIAPAITAQPAGRTVTAGATVTFTATATGTPAPTCQWQRSGDAGATWTNLAETSTTLSFATVLADDGARFRARFTNSVAVQDTSAAILKVAALPLLPVLTAPAYATAGQSDLEASVPAQAGCTYAWTITGGTITAGADATHVTFDAGTVAGDLVLTCKVTNAAGTVSSPGTATTHLVLAPATPVITAPAYATTGQTGLVAAVPAQAGSTFTWTITGGAITAGANSSQVTYTAGPVGDLTLTCVASNAGRALSTPGTAVTHVVAAPVTPVITASSTVATGATNLTASVPEQAGSTYAWTVTGGTLVSGNGTPRITYTAGAVGTLQLGCTVTSAAGVASTPGTASVVVEAGLTINSFTAAPATITAGHASILSWNVTGSTTRSIAPGVGDVTAQTTSNVSPAVTTTYTLTATAAGGQQATAPATVTVVPPATISSFTATPASVTAGQSVSLAATFTAASASVSGGVGAITSGTPVTVAPAVSTTYVLTALSAAGDPVTASAPVTVTPAAGMKVLFDHTKHEEAGSSAYWVICAASEPNPTPANPTAETDWNGGISRWAFDLYKQSWKVQSLPASGKITYGDPTNAQDLSNYNVYVIPECYIMFTAAEKLAVYNYVSHGGGLFLVCNHIGSKRYSGGTDAVTVFNDLLVQNGANWGGFTFVNGHGFDTSGYRNTTSSLFSTAAGKAEDAIIRGPNGTLAMQDFHDYSYIKLNTAANPTAKEILHTQVPADTAGANSFSVYAYVGLGRVVAISDSSPSDDGTSTNHDLIDGYGVNSNRAFFLNATTWLATGGTSN